MSVAHAKCALTAAFSLPGRELENAVAVMATSALFAVAVAAVATSAVFGVSQWVCEHQVVP